MLRLVSRVSLGGSVRLGVLALVWAMSVGLSGGCRPEGPESQVYVHDMGPVFVDPGDPASAVMKYTFPFRNPSSDQDMELQIDETTCGCTKCDIAQERVPPGGETEIILSYDVPIAACQTRSEGALISTNLDSAPQFSVYLKASTFPRVAMIPNTLPVVSVMPGTSLAQKITFVAYEPAEEGETAWNVSTVGERLSLEPSPPRTDEPRNGVRKTTLECTLRLECPAPDDEASAAEYTGRIVASHGDYRLEKTVQWRPENVIAVSPAQLFFQPGESDVDEAVVQMEADEEFAITAIETDAAFVEVEARLDVLARRHEVCIGVRRADDEEAGNRCSLQIQTNHPLQPIVVIPVFILW